MTHPDDDSRTVDELINVTLCESEEDMPYWDAIATLHERASPEVLARAAELCGSRCWKERCVGARILGQLGVPERTFPRECRKLLLDRIDIEQEPRVIASILTSLAHLTNHGTVDVALRFSRHEHEDVRFAVVMALTGQDDDKSAVETLMELTCDADAHVRDWATFGLGSMSELDTPAIRDCLAARLDDEDAETRGEAMVGLANRGDRRAIFAIRKELASNADSYKAWEAAELLGLSDLPASG